MDRIEFRTFGAADLRQLDGTAVRSVLAQPKRVALLSYLAVTGHGAFVRRDTLCGTFWPEAEQSRARHRLRSALHMIRKAIGPDAFMRRGDEEIGLSDEGVWFDARELERAAADGRHEDVLELYRGEFLSGFHVDASNDFEEWLRETRERLRGLAAASAAALVDSANSATDTDEAIRWALRGREISPLDERAVRNHMRALDTAGRRSEALQEFEAFSARLASELGADPSPETAALAAGIRGRDEVRNAAVDGSIDPSRGLADGDDAEIVRPATAGRAAGLTAAVALGGAAFFAARVAGTGADAGQPQGVPALAYLASWLILVVGVWFLFERAEETASPRGRQRVAAWLRPRDRSPAEAADWAEGFIGAFDRIFGSRRLGLQCFLRSMAATVVAVTVLLLLWIAIRPDQFSAFATTQGMRGLGHLVLITFIVNVVADYLSLLETRLALGLLRDGRGPWVRAGVLVADTLATFVVWLTFYAGLPFLVLAGVSPVANDIMLFLQFEVWSYAPTLYEVMTLSAERGGPPVGIWFYSTFVTSIWLWVYLGAGRITRAANATGSIGSRALATLTDLLDAERQPFRVLGLVAILIVTTAYGLGWLINLT